MSKYATTQYNHKRRTILALNDVFAIAITCKLPHKEILEFLESKVYNTNSYKRLTAHSQGHIAGLVDKHFDILLREHLQWGVWYLDVFYVSWNDYPEQLKALVTNAKVTATRHWLATKTKNLPHGCRIVEKTPTTKLYSNYNQNP